MSDQAVVLDQKAAWPEPGVDHYLRELPILVLFPHNRCNCRCLMCDIWKIRQVREITAEDLRPHLDSLRALKVRWIVFSGGEPLLHSDLAPLARICRMEGIRLTLLTAGLLLARHAPDVAAWADDVIVSLDGPPATHDSIRAITGAFGRLEDGVHALRTLRPKIPIHGRCTIQKRNCRELGEVVSTARQLGLDSISFLAADTHSNAFNRPQAWTLERRTGITLGLLEIQHLELEIEAMISEFREEIESGFIAESPDKLRRIVRYFRAQVGNASPEAPRCNAPWVSAVIEADGSVRPCFFHPPVGNIHEGVLGDVLNNEKALEFRRQLSVADNPTCQKCVCSLYLQRSRPEL